jgi:predicted RNA-binding Zn-ribbon protein involved in translation (DUF1610 family)
MRDAGREALVPSLADYALSLRAGSRCHSCGRALRAGERDVSPECLVPSHTLSCPHCGAEVADVPEPPVTTHGDRPSLREDQRSAA